MRHLKTYKLFESKYKDIFDDNSVLIIEILFEIFDEYDLHDSYKIVNLENNKLSKLPCDGCIYLSDINPRKITNIMNAIMMMSGKIREATGFLIDMSIVPFITHSDIYIKFYFLEE